MEATELQSRLKQRHDVVELVTEALDDGSGGVDALAAGELARAAERCWHDGDTREAVALCVDALRVLGPHLEREPEDSDAAYLRYETLRWARWQLRHLLRSFTREPQRELMAVCERLPGDERMVITGAVLRREDVLGAAADPEALSELVADAALTLDEEAQLDALVQLTDIARELLDAKKSEAALSVCREAIEQLADESTMVSDAAKAALAGQVARMAPLLASCLCALDGGEPLRRAVAWLTEPIGGEPRLLSLQLPLPALGESLRRELVSALEKRAAKSEAYAQALAEAGKGVLSDEAYLAICRRVGYLHQAVALLLERGDVDGAHELLAGSLAESDACWAEVKQLVAHGHPQRAASLLAGPASRTVNSELELYLMELLESLGRADEALAVARRRFQKRPALPNYRALREAVGPGAWPALRAELVDELRARRLVRTLVDIAVDDRDFALAHAIVPGLRKEDAAYASQRLTTILADASGPEADALRALLESHRVRGRGAEPAPLVGEAEAPLPTRVRHPKFGEGRVLGSSGIGDQKKLEVDFGESVGKKVLLARFVEPLRD